MNKLVYENNIEVLKKKYPVWADILLSKKKLKRKSGKKYKVIAEQSYSNETILRVEHNDETYYLNGKYAPEKAADDWLEKIGTIDKFATIIIVGISNGVHIKKIMENVADTVNIMIYEPSFEIFQKAMEEVDLSFIFELDIPVGVVVEGINGFEIQRYFRYLITYDNLISLKIFISGNYNQVFPEQMADFFKDLRQYCTEVEVSWNTAIRYTDVNAKNVFHNLRYLYEGYSVSDLEGILPPDIPAIIVSAGPSLNKNLLDIKEAVGKACIIATDTAMKPLLNAGIIPDLFMIVDGLKPGELFEHKDISKCGMVTMTAVSTAPMDLHKGKKYFYYSGSAYETELINVIDAMDERPIALKDIPTGGSVATSAYSLAVCMGARTVILVGQDLALTGNKGHVDGAFKDEKVEIDMDSGEYFEVEAVDGGTVITRIDLKLYLDWFEKTIKDWNMIKTIDATEGGALIRGAKNMTLKEAIKSYCKRNYNVKWHIARIPRIFSTAEEKKYAMRYFRDSIGKLDTVKKKANEGIKYYKKIQKLNENFSENQEKIQKIYKKVKQINDFVEKDSMAETVLDSLKGIEYTLRPSIYKTQGDEKKEIEEIAAQGELILSAMCIGADEIKGLVQETLLPYVEKK